MERTAGTAELEAPDGIHQTLADIQSKTAILPDYGFKTNEAEVDEVEDNTEEAWPAVSAGTTVSGIVGGTLTLILAGFTGFIISIIKRKNKKVRI
jgi:cobalt/nickel transport system permease protein